MKTAEQRISTQPHGQQVLLYAFRYTLGRMTYAIGVMSDVLVREWPGIDVNTRSIIQREIREALEHDRAGMACDRAKWRKILDLEV